MIEDTIAGYGDKASADEDEFGEADPDISLDPDILDGFRHVL